jgi:hypothetical protein
VRENVFPNNQTAYPGYRISGFSGSVATPAADAVLVAQRNATTRLWLVTRLFAALSNPVAVTTDQEQGFYVQKANTYGTSHTGGAALVPLAELTSGGVPASDVANLPAATELRIATTAALGGGGGLAGTNTIGGKACRSGTATDVSWRPPLEWEWKAPAGKAIAVQNNEGILLLNLVTLASGNARIFWEMDLVLA